MPKTFEQCRELFPDFYASVKQAHEESGRTHRGHGLDHDVTVATLGGIIAPNDRVAEMAWCAGMLHSTDRITEKNEDEEFFMCNVEAAMRHNLSSLPHSHFTHEQEAVVLEAALRHSELPQDDHSMVLIVLQDADKLANLMPAVIIRSAQLLPDIPAFEFGYLNGVRNPKSTYHHPLSAMDDLRLNIEEYLPKFRIPKAKALAEKYIDILNQYLRAIEESNKMLGLKGITL